MYYPKSHITPNLYSNGELFILNSNEPYIGHYFTTIDDKAYTGRFPGDGNNIELLPPPVIPALNDDGTEVVDYRFYGNDNATYSNLKLITPSSPTSGAPIPFYPQPTDQDYQLGEFTRYFAKKVNENKFIETEFLFENPVYIGMQLPWLISGDIDKVIEVNQNIVKLREQEFGINGLAEFLKFNYIKFYEAKEIQSNLSTDGTQFKNRRTGAPYSGFYHIHPIKGPMVGAFHISASHDYLDPIIQQLDISTPSSITPSTPSSAPYSAPTSTPSIAPRSGGGGSTGGGGSYGGGGGGGGGY